MGLIHGKSEKKPYFIAQPELSNLVCDLTKQQSYVLAPHLQQWNLLDKNVRITVFKKCYADLKQFFGLENGLL